MLIHPRAANRRRAGFTLVELLVAVAVLAVGAALAAPDLVRLMAKNRMRNLADGMLGGLQYARAEAIRRNAAVSFALSSDRNSWTVSQVTPATTLQSRVGGDAGTGGVTITPDTVAASVTFLPTGVLQAGTQMRRITVTSAIAASDERRIDIHGGGLLRMCDPAVTVAGDPRRC